MSKGVQRRWPFAFLALVVLAGFHWIFVLRGCDDASSAWGGERGLVRYPFLDKVAHGDDPAIGHGLSEVLEAAVARASRKKSQDPLNDLLQQLQGEAVSPDLRPPPIPRSAAAPADAVGGPAAKAYAASAAAAPPAVKRPPDAPKVMVCDDGWTLADGACFKFVDVKLPFADLDSSCNGIKSGAHVAMIASGDQNLAASKLLGDKTEVFIGLRWDGAQHVWPDGSAADWQAQWHEEADGKEPCTRIIGADSGWNPGAWDNWPCEHALPFLCSYTVGGPAAAEEQQEPLHESGHKGGKHDTIWTYWDYPSGPDSMISLNIETWQKHASGMKIVLVNNTNIAKYVPDLPREFFRLPYAAAKSDFVRASVLYHQGGIYMDTDFLLMTDLDDILKKLDNYDIVSYSDEGAEENKLDLENCVSQQYSSNWLAANKGNKFHEIWWTNMKQKMTRMCAEGEMDREKICCHEAFAPLPEKRSCHIPWAALELLKQPWKDADRKGPPQKDPTKRSHKGENAGEKAANPEEVQRVKALIVKGNENSLNHHPGTRVHCLKNELSHAPYLNGEAYWQPWDSKTQRTGKKQGGDYDNRFNCWEGEDDDLICSKTHRHEGQQRVFKKFFRRASYHLFFSTKHVKGMSRQQVLDGDWLLSELYRRSLGLPAPGR